MSEFAGKIIEAAERFRVSEPEGGWDEHDRRVAAELAKTAARETRDLHAERLHAMGVPRKLHQTILDGPEHTAAVLAMRTFHVAVRQGKEHLAVLVGETGCGKSLAAATWLLHAADADDGAPSRVMPRKFIAAADYCRISDYDAVALDAFGQARFLVIDDLGVEYGDKRQYHASRIDALLGKRHGNMLPTVVTTNLGMAAISECYGARVESRLNEAQVTPLRDEPDLRKRPAVATGEEPGKP